MGAPLAFSQRRFNGARRRRRAPDRKGVFYLRQILEFQIWDFEIYRSLMCRGQIICDRAESSTPGSLPRQTLLHPDQSSDLKIVGRPGGQRGGPSRAPSRWLRFWEPWFPKFQPESATPRQRAPHPRLAAQYMPRGPNRPLHMSIKPLIQHNKRTPLAPVSM